MITQFALRLICGLSCVWCLMPRAQVTSGFFRIQMLVTLGLAMLATVAAGKLTGTDEVAVLSPLVTKVIGISIGICSFLGSMMWTLERRAAGARFGFAIAALSAVGAALVGVTPSQMQSLDGPLFCLSELSIGWVSGSAVAGMLLGHWYLTAPTMSVSPLNRINAFLGIAAIWRLILAAVGLVAFAPWKNSSSEVQWSSTYGVWLSLEWFAGILGQLLVVLMVWRIMKLRNTQAATGVLFVGVILAFLGEMTSALLRRELNLPL